MADYWRQIRTYLALMTLAFGAFVAQTTEYLPIGLLPQIGADFSVSNAYVGALVTGYAWIAAITAIPFTLATVRFNRRALFLCLIGIIALANGLAAVAPNYWSLAFFRFIVALTHGVFWATLASFAVRIAPNLSAGRATAIVFVGISLSIVAGVPIAAAMGQWFGWRIAFGLFSVLALIAMVTGMALLPSIPAQVQSRGQALPRKNRLLYGVALITGLSLTAHFCAYTYVVPLLKEVAQIKDASLPVLFMVFGAAGLAGNVVSGWLSGRVKLIVALAILGTVSAQLVLLLTTWLPELIWMGMALWGVSISMLIVGLQSWILEISPGQEDAASALYVTTFNIGIGCGAFLGGVALQVGGVYFVLGTGISCGVLAGILLMLIGTHKKHQIVSIARS